ncbi:MAG: DNA polymerase III subunit delta, partial [Rhodobacterales bacterium CG_4_10_14_0_8_um_filter_70_9]
RAAAQARRWGAARLERALETLYEADAALRGGSNAPPAALLERALLRLANAAPR